MKRRILYLLAIAFFPVIVFGQIPKPQLLPVRQINGMVTDSADHGIRGALIKLVSKSDTLLTHSNEDGLFFFKDVKSWEFTLSVSSLGYRTFVKIGKYNDSNSRITLDQIILRTSSQMLQEVVVKKAPQLSIRKILLNTSQVIM